MPSFLSTGFFRAPFPATCVLIAATAIALPASAQTEELPSYRVEYIVIRHLNPVSGTEIWPLPDGEASEIPAQRFGNVSGDALELGDMVRRLSRASGLRVIGHSGWEQTGYDREGAKRKIIRRVSSTGETVSGHFVLSRQRYLRLEMDLALTFGNETYHLQTGRRMLSRQLHYFDHPHFGVIAKITPL